MARHKFPLLHPWKISSEQAKQIQTDLRRLVITVDEIDDIRAVAGVDVGFLDNNATALAAVVVLTYPELVVLDSATAKRRVQFPYIPGYLSFREVPSILAALTKIEHLPDLILCDGQGYAHPRRFGLACHLGIITEIPTIGVAKTRLLGDHKPVGEKKGAWKPLMHRDERIGAALRTRSNTKPVYVSVGHKVCLASAIKIALKCCTQYRLPETTRAAHKLASTLS